MAIDPDHCATCYALATSGVEITVEPTDDPLARRFVPNVPVLPANGHVELSTSAEARQHPLGRALWGSGVTHVLLEPDAVTITKIEAMPWDFIEPRLANVLAERLTLAGHSGNDA